MPQGTILGPLLFILYLNSLFNIETCGSIISFADDTAIFYSAENWAQLKIKAENDLGNIKEWFDHKLLTINYEKTYFVPFCSYQTSLPKFKQLKISETDKITISSKIKYLGIVIDQHLTWNEHVNFVVNKLRSILYLFKQLKQYLNQKNLKTAYHALVESHISYGIIGWGGILNDHLNKLNVIQKRFLKLMLHKETTFPSDLLFMEASLFDARQLYFLTLCTNEFSNKKDKIQHQIKTRNQNKSKIPKMQKTIGQRSHLYLKAKAYNKLPNDVRDAKNVHVFKSKCKHFIHRTPRVEIHKIIDMKNN